MSFVEYFPFDLTMMKNCNTCWVFLELMTLCVRGKKEYNPCHWELNGHELTLAHRKWTIAVLWHLSMHVKIHATNTWANTDAESLIISLQMLSHPSQIRRHSFDSKIIHIVDSFFRQYSKTNLLLFYVRNKL